MLLYILIWVMSIAFCTSNADTENSTVGLIPCNKDWFFYDGKCYKTFGGEIQLNWFQASEWCAKENGSLATVNSEKLQDFLVMFLLLRLQSNAWIGLHDQVEQWRFTWDDGSAVNYTNWDKYQPTGVGLNSRTLEDCVEMRYFNTRNGIGTWNDMTCDAKQHFFCQADKSENILSQDPRFCTLEEGEGWKYLNSCYHIVTEEKTWEDAERHCKEIYSGHLVTVLNEQTEMFLNYLTSDYDKSFWIGIKIGDNDVQMWSSGLHVIYKKFGFKRKVFMPGSCAMMTGEKLWEVGPCERKLPFICEKSDKSALVLKKAPEGWQCPSQSNEWIDIGGEYCYIFEIFSAYNWNNANYNCVRKGGTLASIHSEAESYVLQPYVTNSRLGVYIGLHRDFLNTKEFEWVDGSPLNYTNWYIGEPNNIEEECVEMPKGTMTWNDISCDRKLSYICSAKKVPPTTPELSAPVPNECVCTNSSNVTRHKDDSAAYVSTEDVCASGKSTKHETGIIICIVLIMILIGVVVYQFRKKTFCKTVHNRFIHKDSAPASFNHISSEGILKPDEYEC